MTKSFLRGLLLALLPLFACAARGAPELPPVVLAIDASFGIPTSTSAPAIRLGAEIAAAEVNAAGGVLGGRPLKIITRNNNAIPSRAAENLRELAADANVVAVMGGQFGPVYQELTPLIHEIGIPYLNPWAATEEIGRQRLTPSFMFRLSTTDSWAAETIVRSAAARGYKFIGLLLPNSAWGRSSHAAAKTAVAARRDMRIVGEQWYNYGDQHLQLQYEALRRAGATAIFLVANEVEGAALLREISRRPKAEQLPVLSHWGITGGRFFQLAGADLAKIDFSFIQTYSFIGANDEAARRVLAAVRKATGIADPRAIPSPVGLAHAYDLTHLLALAIQRAGGLDRATVRTALENIPDYRGLIKRYRRPFTAEDHEALDAGQSFMARYATDGAIVRSP